MKSYRLIVVSNENGSSERVYFLDRENEEPATDYCDDGETVDVDMIIQSTLPTCFPLEYGLQRV